MNLRKAQDGNRKIRNKERFLLLYLLTYTPNTNGMEGVVLQSINTLITTGFLAGLLGAGVSIVKNRMEAEKLRLENIEKNLQKTKKDSLDKYTKNKETEKSLVEELNKINIKIERLNLETISYTNQIILMERFLNKNTNNKENDLIELEKKQNLVIEKFKNEKKTLDKYKDYNSIKEEESTDEEEEETTNKKKEIFKTVEDIAAIRGYPLDKFLVIDKEEELKEKKKNQKKTSAPETLEKIEEDIQEEERRNQENEKNIEEIENIQKNIVKNRRKEEENLILKESQKILSEKNKTDSKFEKEDLNKELQEIELIVGKNKINNLMEKTEQQKEDLNKEKKKIEEKIKSIKNENRQLVFCLFSGLANHSLDKGYLILPKSENLEKKSIKTFLEKQNKNLEKHEGLVKKMIEDYELEVFKDLFKIYNANNKTKKSENIIKKLFSKKKYMSEEDYEEKLTDYNLLSFDLELESFLQQIYLPLKENITDDEKVRLYNIKQKKILEWIENKNIKKYTYNRENLNEYNRGLNEKLTGSKEDIEEENIKKTIERNEKIKKYDMGRKFYFEELKKEIKLLKFKEKLEGPETFLTAYLLKVRLRQLKKSKEKSKDFLIKNAMNFLKDKSMNIKFFEKVEGVVFLIKQLQTEENTKVHPAAIKIILNRHLKKYLEILRKLERKTETFLMLFLLSRVLKTIGTDSSKDFFFEKGVSKEGYYSAYTYEMLNQSDFFQEKTLRKMLENINNFRILEEWQGGVKNQGHEQYENILNLLKSNNIEDLIKKLREVLEEENKEISFENLKEEEKKEILVSLLLSLAKKLFGRKEEYTSNIENLVSSLDSAEDVSAIAYNTSNILNNTTGAAIKSIKG